MQLLNQYFLSMDVAEIIKIRPSLRNEQDFLAWQPDKLGIFSVRSAYRLALQLQMNQQGVGATSSRPDGERPGWRLIWQCPVPPKVGVFAWKVASNILATEVNMKTRHMTHDATCRICGREDEDTFHALVRCTHARLLWEVMREVWDLPRDDMVRPDGHEWLLQILARQTETQRSLLLMLLWRIWHVHNELTHNKPAPPAESSRRFLCSYMDTLMYIKQHPTADVVKGKETVSYISVSNQDKHMGDGRKKIRKKWQPPEEGRMKLNVDGAYANDGTAGAGMILRDYTGAVIFAASRQIRVGIDALDSELATMEEGLALALHWTPDAFTLESDCVEAIKLLDVRSPNASIYASRISVIRELIRERDIQVAQISRDANKASHELARLGRVQGRTAVWLRNYPPEIAEAICADCTHTPV